MTTGKGGYASNLQNRGQQDKRPRHVCAAKSLSAHQFCRHALRIALCCCAANPVKVLNN